MTNVKCLKQFSCISVIAFHADLSFLILSFTELVTQLWTLIFQDSIFSLLISKLSKYACCGMCIYFFPFVHNSTTISDKCTTLEFKMQSCMSIYKYTWISKQKKNWWIFTCPKSSSLFFVSQSIYVNYQNDSKRLAIRIEGQWRVERRKIFGRDVCSNS